MNREREGEGEGEVDRVIAALRGEVDRLRSGMLDARARHERQARESDAERAALARRVVALERRVAASAGPDRLPVLCHDLARWSLPDQRPGPPPPPPPPASTRLAAVAVPVGPPPAPPSLDDLSAVDRHVQALRRLLSVPAVPGKPFHAHFDEERLRVLQAKLREANLQAERLLGQVERSKTSKDMLWHLMVAQRSEEVNKKRRG